MKSILAPGGKFRATIIDTSTGKQLLGHGGELLGTYNKNTDQTLLPGGRLYSYGDCLMELIEE